MKILVIAPHPDDEVLGCGGTIAKCVSKGDEVYIAIVTKGCSPIFSEDQVSTVRNDCLRADKYLGVKDTIFLDFPAAMLEEVPRHQINDSLIKLVQDIKPETVFIPHRGDMQLDHKMIVDAAMVALRPKYSHVVKRIYSYETLSETGWDVPNTVNEFIPNVYNDISQFIDKKLEAIRMFTNQVEQFPSPRSEKTVKALAEYRGSMMGLEAAEAFSLVREVNI